CRASASVTAIVVHCRYSSVKLGIAHFHGTVLRRLVVLSALPVTALALAGVVTRDLVMRAVVDVIRTTVQEAASNHVDIDEEVAVSLATYVKDRRSFPSNEPYDLLTNV